MSLLSLEFFADRITELFIIDSKTSKLPFNYRTLTIT
jgi:hypothetical protein